VSIDFFNPVRNVAIANEANARHIAQSAHLLGEVVGLALRAVASCPMELNLRPARVIRAHEVERRRPFLIGTAVCVIAALLGWSLFYLHAAGILRATKQQVDAKVETLRVLQGKLDGIRKDATSLDNLALPLLNAVKARSFWPQLLEDLNARLPKENIWVTELIPLSKGKPVIGLPGGTASGAAQPVTSVPTAITPGRPTGLGKGGGPAIDGLLIRGLYLWNARQQEVVVDYFKNLVGSPFFAIDPKNQQKVIKPTMPNNTEWAFPYELQLDLKESLPLQ
jgi:hypothetical protein